MKFRQFLQLELDGLFGPIKAGGNLGIIKSHIKDAQPVKNKGSTVGRLANHVVSAPTPARPVSLGSSFKKPMTIPSVLK